MGEDKDLLQVLRMSKSRLQAKWRNFFRMLDEDGDGQITVEDFGLKAQRIIDSYGLEDLLRVRCSQILLRWWHICQDLLGEPKPRKVSQPRFVEILSQLYCTDKGKLEQTMRELSIYLFQLMDADGDGSITSDELDKMNKCLGMKNSSLNAAIFDAWDDDENGEISQEEYSTGMIAYLTSSDPQNDYGFVFQYDKNMIPNKRR